MYVCMHVCIYIYIYTYILCITNKQLFINKKYTCLVLLQNSHSASTPNLPTNIVGFRWASEGSTRDLNFKGWNFQARRAFPGSFEPSNASRRKVSRRIGRTAWNP